MVRSGSEALTDTPAVERSPAKACSESPHPIDNERKHRNGVPIKRNQRLHLELPVAVYTGSPDTKPEPLLESALSAVIYPSGCVLGLAATVELGQELFLVNPQSKLKAVCRVAGFESQKNGSQPMVRLEFTQPVPKFWGVMFPPEHADPAERKLPRLPRRNRRVEAASPIEVRQTEDPSNEITDMCVTDNISREGLYFKSDHLSYREGMRLTISFLRRSDFFAPNASYAGKVLRIDRIEDDRLGVAVRLVSNKVKQPPIPISSRSEVSTKGAGQSLAVAPGRLSRSLPDTGTRIVRSPVTCFGRMLNALVRLATSVAQLCKSSIGGCRKSTSGLVRSSCSAALPMTTDASSPLAPQPPCPESSGHPDGTVDDSCPVEALASLDPAPHQS